VRILRLFFSFFLSLAILTVGLAGAVASAQKDCLMPMSQDSMSTMHMSSAMDDMQMDQTQHMPCEEHTDQHPSPSHQCLNDQKCIMYHAQILTFDHIQIELPTTAFSSTPQAGFFYQNPALPFSDTVGIWRPPRTA